MNSSCIKSLSELSASTLFQYADYSGKGINDLGLYEECLNVPNSSYYLLNIGIPGDNFNYLHFFSGLCFSENCSSFDIDNFLPNISKALNYSLDGYSIQSLKVDGNEGNNTMNSSSIGIIFILCLLAFLPFVYPIWNYLISPGKKENKPKLDLENNSTIVNNTLTTSLVSDKEKEIHVAKKEPKIMQFFKCFSLPDNYKQLMTTRTGPLDFFNGVRALSILYVIFGHDYYLRNGASRNPAYILDFVKIPYFLIIASGFYAVDVFFWLSGFFLAFVILDPATRKYIFIQFNY